MITVRFDGGCIPNPNGHASCACLITREGNEVYRKSVYLGKGAGMTCNVAEFEGALLAIEWLMLNCRPGEQVRFLGESQIVINRLNRSNDGNPVGVCAPLALHCRRRIKDFFLRSGIAPSFKWQRRENNSECDAMCDLRIEEARLAEKRAE